jgi:hypothetical protein
LTMKQNARVSRLRVFRLGTDGVSAAIVARRTGKSARKGRKKKS